MLTFNNEELVPVVNFLGTLELTPKVSRCRTKLVKKLMAKVEAFGADEKALLELYGERDEDGKLVESDSGYRLQVESANDYHAEYQDLLNENVNIDMTEIKEQIRLLVTALNELDIKLANQDAMIFDELMEKLEEEL
jgi:hypothetical protein